MKEKKNSFEKVKEKGKEREKERVWSERLGLNVWDPRSVHIPRLRIESLNTVTGEGLKTKTAVNKMWPADRWDGRRLSHVMTVHPSLTFWKPLLTYWNSFERLKLIEKLPTRKLANRKYDYWVASHSALRFTSEAQPFRVTQSRGTHNKGSDMSYFLCWVVVL